MTTTTNQAAEREALIQRLRAAVQTYPQMSEDEPGGYMTEFDQLLDEAAAALSQSPVAVPDKWRELALKFDGQRMQALAHLRTLLEHGEAHASAVREFLAAAPAAPAPVQQAPSAFVVSVVMTKEIPTGINTQNKLYAIAAASAKEAEGLAVAEALSEFKEHAVHTVCHMAAPAAPALVPAGFVLVPLDVLVDASRAIGHFVSDEGWGAEDMHAMDNLDAYIAQHMARAASKGEQA